MNDPTKDEIQRKQHRADDDTTRSFKFGEADNTPKIQDMSKRPLAATGHFGDYELLEFIAHGGMGVVYKARQTELNRVVALKMILSGKLATEKDVQRFRAEAQAAAHLDHPFIVPIYEVGEHDGNHFFSMGLVEGESLAELLRNRPLPGKESAQLLAQISEAVAHAHLHGVIHRDLKPSNILLDRNGEPRVADFGLAKQMERAGDLTITGQILGTPNYMSPEQARGQTDLVDERSDVYALGAILYCCLTGRPPHQAASTQDTLKSVIEQEPVAPTHLDKSIARDLETICLKALSKDQKSRYQTALELKEDLQRLVENKPILARPTSQAEKLRLWCLRNPWKATALVAMSLVVLLLSVGAPIVAWRESVLKTAAQNQTVRAETAEKKAKSAEKKATQKAAENAFAAARIASERGAWRECLEKLDEAREIGFDDDTAIRMKRVVALRALNRYAEWTEEIDWLTSNTQGDGRDGEVLIHRAEQLRMLGRHEDAEVAIKEALELNLNPAFREFALAQIAPTTPEIAQHLQRALEIDPFLLQANQLLGMTLLMLGENERCLSRLQIAKTLFPDDPTFPFFEALVAVLDRDAENLARLQSELNGMLDPEQFAWVSAMLVWGENIVEVVGEIGEPPSIEGIFNAAASGVRANALITKFQSEVKSGTSDSTYGIDHRFTASILPQMGQSYDALVDLFPTTIPLGFRSKHAIQRLEESAEIHPDGLFQFCIGRIQYDEGEFEKSEKAFATAADQKSIIPGLRKYSLVYAAVAAQAQKKDEDYLRAADFAKLRLAMKTPLSRLEQIYFATMAIAITDEDLQALSFAGAVDLPPKDLEMYRATADLLSGAPARALARLDKIDAKELSLLPLRQLHPAVKSKSLALLKKKYEQLNQPKIETGSGPSQDSKPEPKAQTDTSEKVNEEGGQNK